jgi:hypothetical protein
LFIVLVLVVVLVLGTAYFLPAFSTCDGLRLREDSSVCDIGPAKWLFEDDDEYEDDNPRTNGSSSLPMFSVP